MCVAEGWGFVEASTLYEMWSAVALNDPWVVVMPLHVEATAARAVTARIRMRFPHGEVAVVGLINASAPQLHAEALLAGFDVYLSTASGPAALQSELRKVFEVVRGHRGRSAPSP